MTDLLGIWSLDAATPPTPSPRLAARLCAALPGSRHARVTLSTPRLWLCAAEPHLLRDGPRLVATEGLALGVERTLARLSKSESPFPEGHLVLAATDGARLTLGRSLSGGEQLFYARIGQALVFSASLRPLIAHPELEPEIDPEVVADVLLSGRRFLHSHTLVSPIHEVLAGHTLEVDAIVGRQRFHCEDALRHPVGDPARLARDYRRALTEAVARAAGSARPVPVALSGGLDSSAIAAAAVDAFGADQVEVFTYEFDDPEHETELGYARRVAKTLGIRRHRTFALDPEAFHAAVPEMVWRSESLVHAPKTFMMLVARAVREMGHERYLTGFGIGSHMATLHEIGALFERVPVPPRWILGMWRKVRFEGDTLLDGLKAIHPALETPHPRLYPMLLAMLQRAGYVDDMRPAFPEGFDRLLGRRPHREETVLDRRELPLGRRLQLHACAHLLSCIDATRSEKASRELGVRRVAPAHFLDVVRYAYFPPEPPPSLRDGARWQRPGKHLLQRAYAGVLPDDILYRVKNWDHAVASASWWQRARRAMLDALWTVFPRDFDRFGADLGEVARRWEPYSILASGLSLRFFERLLLERDPTRSEPPTWDELRPRSGR